MVKKNHTQFIPCNMCFIIRKKAQANAKKDDNVWSND